MSAIDSIKALLNKLGIKESDYKGKNLDSTTLVSIFQNADSDDEGTDVSVAEFARALAMNYGDEKIFGNYDMQYFQDAVDVLDEQNKSEFNGIAGFDGDSTNVSEADVKNIFAADPASDVPETGNTGDNKTPDATSGTDAPKSNYPDAVTEGKELSELEADRSDALSELSDVQKIQEAIENSEEVKSKQADVDSAKETYDKALDNLAENDEEIEKLRDSKTEKETEINNKKTQINETKNNITTKESEKSDVEAQLSSLVEPQPSDYTKIVTDEEGNQHEEFDSDAYNAAHAEYEQKKAELEEKKGLIEEQLVNLQENLATQESELTVLEQDATKIDTQIAEALQKKTGESVKAVQDALTAYNNAKEALNTTKNTLKENMDVDIAKLRENISKYDEAINKKRAEELKESENKEDDKKYDKWKDLDKYPPETIEKIAKEYDEKYGNENKFLNKANEIYGTDAKDVSELQNQLKTKKEAAKEAETNEAYGRFENNNATPADWDKYILNGSMENLDYLIENKYGSSKALLDAVKEKFGENSSQYARLTNRLGNYEAAKELQTDSNDKEKWNSTILNTTPANAAEIASFYGEDALYTQVRELFGSEAEKSLKEQVREGKLELIKGQELPDIPSYAVSLKDLKDGYKIQGNQIYDASGKVIGKVTSNYKDVDGDKFDDKVKNYYLYGENPSVEKTEEASSDEKTEAADKTGETADTEAPKDDKSSETSEEKPSETTFDASKLPAGFHANSDGSVITDVCGVKVNISDADKVKELGYEEKDGMIKDNDNNIKGYKIDDTYFLYDMSQYPENWSISDKGYLQYEKEDGKMQGVHVVSGKEARKTDGEGHIVDEKGNIIGYVLTTSKDADGDGVEDRVTSYYMNTVEDNTIPHEFEYGNENFYGDWFHLADNTYLDENNREMTKSDYTQEEYFAKHTNYVLEESKAIDITDSDGKTSKGKLYYITDKDSHKIIGRAYTHLDEKGNTVTDIYEFTEDQGVFATDPPVTTTPPPGGGGGGGGGGGTPPATDPTSHQDKWKQDLDPNSKAGKYLQEILDLIKKGASKEEILAKMQAALSDSNLSTDERIQLMNAISKSDPQVLKDLSSQEGFNDEYAKLMTDMMNNSDYTLDDITKFDEMFRNMTGQKNSNLTFSDSKTEEKYLKAITDMYKKASEEDIKKLNGIFDLENNLEGLLKYKDKDGNTLLSTIMDKYNKDSSSSSYIKEHPDFENYLKETYMKDGEIDYEKFFEDIFKSGDLDSVEKKKAAIYFLNKQSGIEDYLTKALESGQNNSDALLAILKLLGNELPKKH